MPARGKGVCTVAGGTLACRAAAILSSPALSIWPGYPTAALTSSFSREDYLRAVGRAIEYIHAGDIFQVVLSQRFEADVTVDPFTVYRALRHVNPSPYMYFIRMGGVSVVGSSPEMPSGPGNRCVSIPAAPRLSSSAVPTSPSGPGM